MSKLYTCDEVAQRFSVKVTTVWFWIRAGKLKAVKIGGNYRIKQEHLDEFEKNGEA